MSDKKNDIETDFEEKLAEITSQQSRNRTNNNIYERFISRVQGSEDEGSDDNDTKYVKRVENAEKLFAYEPLSTNKLSLFDNQDDDELEQLEIETTTTTDADFDFLDQETFISEMPETSISKSIKKETPSIDKSVKNSRLDDDIFADESDDDYLAYTNKPTVRSDIDETTHTPDVDGWVAQEVAIQPVVKEKSASQSKPANSKKSLIIGMIFGSLLIAIIVMTLIFTGVLSTSTKTIVSDDTDSSMNSSIDTAATTENSTPVVSTAQATDTDDEQLATDASTIEQPIVATPQSDLAPESQASGATEKVEPSNVSPTGPTANDLESEPAITYEDFREESQNTLYRETND